MSDGDAFLSARLFVEVSETMSLISDCRVQVPRCVSCNIEGVMHMHDLMCGRFGRPGTLVLILYH